MSELTIQVTGMNCEHCVQTLERAIGSLPGVHRCEVRVGHVRVAFDENSTSKADLLAAVRQAGAFDIGGFTGSGG